MVPGQSAILKRRTASSIPYWSQVLRALREARGITQDGWATSLGYGRATIQRWERGTAVPDAQAEQALIELCRTRGLFRRYDSGPLRGQVLTDGWLRNLLADARLADGMPPSQDDNRVPPRPTGTDLAADGSPFVTAEARPHHLPLPLSSFVGREQELAEITDLLSTNRLLTLTGPGGVGKTRLALAAATRVERSFTDGAVFVPLESLKSASLVASTALLAVGAREIIGQPAQETLKGYLQHKEMLLILDNFEHVIEAALLLPDLLTTCPSLHMLITSRSPLHLRSEQEMAVQPLQVPDLRQLPSAELLFTYASVALFMARGRAVRSSFALSDENREAIAAICHALDGLPLAIELAAARIKILPAAALLSRLDHRLSMLTGGNRDLPLRHQTLHETINWSYELLSDGERRLFRHLSVFAGGCTIESAEAICPEPADRQLDAMQSLVDKSLLRQDGGTEQEPRFAMLETVREFAAKRLEELDETTPAKNAHLRFFRRLVGAVGQGLSAADEGAWMRRMNAEVDNIRVALAWSITDRERVYDGMVLAGTLYPLWAQGHVEEGCEWLERILTDSTGMDVPARAGALITLGQLLIYRSGFAAAIPYIEECIALSRSLGRHAMLAKGLSLLANARLCHGPAASEAAEEAVALARTLGDPALLLRSLYSLGAVAFWQGDLVLAHDASEEAVRWGRESVIYMMTAAPLRELGNVAYRRGDYAAARGYLDQSIALLREIDGEPTLAQSYASLGRVALATGDVREAETHFREALRVVRDSGGMSYLPLALSGLASTAMATGRPELAARKFGAAEALGAGMLWPMGALYRDEHTEAVAMLRARLGAAMFDRLWSEGRALLPEEALREELMDCAHV